MTAISVGRHDPSPVAAGHFDFGRIHKGIVELGIGDHHPISHRDKISGAPERPPPPSPIAQAPIGHAARLEGAEYLHAAVKPERCPTVDGVAQEGHADLAGWYHDCP